MNSTCGLDWSIAKAGNQLNGTQLRLNSIPIDPVFENASRNYDDTPLVETTAKNYYLDIVSGTSS